MLRSALLPDTHVPERVQAGLAATGRLPRIAAFLVLILATLPMTGRAILDEALSLAFEAAVPYVEQGFEVREDSWSGEIPSGEPKLVRHQLFRGNEYWFWLATSTPDCEVTVEIFDADGNSVGLESFSKDNAAGVRVLPQKTGTYYLRVTVTSKANEPVLDWAMVYGYR
ncbi:MAG: T9SS type A sorting domain-containing protein [Verrucomicrobiae bacterium]|nr:T9SS type A sorting domain-containing protein [Verrucomicrobiae bacterium]MCB1088909.1 T9SS type A sorting domain-containing protein [Verrucomicrobiae bacterium]